MPQWLKECLRKQEQQECEPTKSEMEVHEEGTIQLDPLSPLEPAVSPDNNYMPQWLKDCLRKQEQEDCEPKKSEMEVQEEDMFKLDPLSPLEPVPAENKEVSNSTKAVLSIKGDSNGNISKISFHTFMV